MMSNGQLIGDGSWILKVHVTNLQDEREIRVKGDLHIGGVMLRLVEDLGLYLFKETKIKGHSWLNYEICLFLKNRVKYIISLVLIKINKCFI